jgi:hypothetical protein
VELIAPAITIRFDSQGGIHLMNARNGRKW